MRRDVMRRARLIRVEKTSRFRKNEVLANRRAAPGKSSASKSLPPVRTETPDCRALVIAPHTLPLPPSSLPIPCPSPSSHVDMLGKIREARAPYTPALSYQRRQESIRKQRERAERRLPPAWEKARELDRAPAYMSAILDSGRAASFTLNFGPDILRRAEKAKEGVFHHLRSRISRELKKALGGAPSLVCALDRTASGRFHIHGAMALPAGQDEAVMAALKRAGGKWAHKAGGERQVHLQTDQYELNGEKTLQTDRPLDAGWAGYLTKLAKRLRKDTNHSVLYASPDIKRKAEEIYKQNKQISSSNNSINIDLSTSDESEIAIAAPSRFSDEDGVNHQMRAQTYENGAYRHGRLRGNPRGYAAGRAPGRDDRRRHPCRQADGLHPDLPRHRPGRPARPWAGAIQGRAGRAHPAHARSGGRDQAGADASAGTGGRPAPSREKGRLMPAQDDNRQPVPLKDLGFKVPETLRLRFKLEAVRRRTTMRQLFEDAFRHYLEQRPAPRPDDKF